VAKVTFRVSTAQQTNWNVGQWEKNAKRIGPKISQAENWGQGDSKTMPIRGDRRSSRKGVKVPGGRGPTGPDWSACHRAKC